MLILMFYRGFQGMVLKDSRSDEVHVWIPIIIVRKQR